MKKVLVRTLIVLLIILAVVGGTATYLTLKKPDDTEKITMAPTMVDSSGDSHMVVVDGNGTSYAVVTDKDGNRYAAEYSGNQIGATVGQINDQVALEDLPENNKSTPATDNANVPTGNVATTAPTTTPSHTQTPATNAPSVNTPTTVPATESTGPLKAYRIDKYQKIFSSGTYLMEITTNDPDLGDLPITMAIKNGNMYVDTTIEGLKCQMLYQKSNETMYLVFNDWKKYCKLPEDLMGEDFDMSSMMADFGAEEIGDVSVAYVEIDGQKLILESYVSAVDGSTVNYYFNGEELVRRDNITPAGVIDSVYVSKFMSDVPDSYFEIPAGYGYLNLSWLEALM